MHYNILYIRRFSDNHFFFEKDIRLSTYEACVNNRTCVLTLP